MTYYRNLLLGLLVLLLASCKTDYANLPTYTPTKQLQAVIEVPAGTNRVLQYNPETKEFIPAKEAGKDRVIGFLPYPGNYGFIPSTEVNRQGEALDILIIAESVATGTVMEVIPVGVLQVEVAGELKPVVVAVPSRPSEQLISATDYASLSRQYPAVKDILHKWFANHSPTTNTKVAGWRDDRFAEEMIQRWMKL
ncbi:inorganic diphosphatase [Pontibacter ruber]|uniref:inorganic diphosphatase n=1 Tax=Pontibacter ruber TaxID=1343895 RepID=A0ABW5CXD9_9BACT|nr:inorganic diphosphatase [Pontibacter ruber]